MADYELIDAYLGELRSSLGTFDDATAVFEETEDHLFEAVSHLEAAGMARQDAQALALARYGSAAFVARVCMTESRKGAAVSTTFTRRAGIAAAITPLLLVLGIIGNTVFWGENQGLGGTLHGASSGLLLPLGLSCFLLGLLGLRARHRGLGRLGTAALVLVIATPFLPRSDRGRTQLARLVPVERASARPARTERPPRRGLRLLRSSPDRPRSRLRALGQSSP